MKPISPINPIGHIQSTVDRAIELREQIDKLEAELKELEQSLKDHALAHPEQHEELKDAERDGRRFLARGSKRIVPIIITADKIVGQFMVLSAEHQKIQASVRDCGGHRSLKNFFRLVNLYKNNFDSGKQFRARAIEIYGKDNAPRFIDACLSRDKDGMPRNDVKIDWDHSEPIAP